MKAISAKAGTCKVLRANRRATAVVIRTETTGMVVRMLVKVKIN